MNIGGYCPGCGGGEGNQSCSIARCSLDHERVEYCYLCSDYPCVRFDNVDSSDSFITHRNQFQDIDRVHEIGISLYNEELIRKREILNLLLNEYNDGRIKSFYCLAAGLLPLRVLENVILKIKSDSCMAEPADLKDRAKQVSDLLVNEAEELGIELKLRRKSE